MHTINLILTLLLGVTFYTSTSQTFYSDFEDGTLQGWTNTDGSTSLLTVEEANYKYLQKTADGSNTPEGVMSIVNMQPDAWSGNYFYEIQGTEALRTVDDIILKNPNNFDLHLRYSFTGANGYTVVTTNPVIVPANSDWDFYNLSYYPDFENNALSNLTGLTDTGTLPWEEVMQNIHDLFEAVETFQIFHSENIAGVGEQITGILQIESIASYELLSVDEAIKPSFKVFPNPMGEFVQISSENTIERIVIYNSQGLGVYENRLNSFDGKVQVQNLTTGIYLVEVTFKNGVVASKKLVKK